MDSKTGSWEISVNLTGGMYLWFCSSAGGAVPELSLLMGENKGLYGRNQGHGSAAEDTAFIGKPCVGRP